MRTTSSTLNAAITLPYVSILAPPRQSPATTQRRAISETAAQAAALSNSQAQEATAAELREEHRIILLGLDEVGRPHAAAFKASEAKAVQQASVMMQMLMVEPDNPTLLELAQQLPKGRLFASGKAFVPFVKQVFYDKLVGLLPDGVLPPFRDSSCSAGAGVGPSAATSVVGHERNDDIPKDWSNLKVGSIVVAWESEDDGWWLAVVLKEQHGAYTLRWRDYPQLGTVVRQRKHIALLHPSYSAT
jgi:hypothetical protein